MIGNVRHGQTRTDTNTKSRGSALLIAILLVAILGIGSAALFKHLNRSFDDYNRFEHDLKIVHLADAGIDTAIAALRKGNAPETLELALGEGAINVIIAPEKDAGTWRITSEAALQYEGIVRATGTYTATVRIMPNGNVRRLSWQREKK